jgi:hypothetical protein
MVFCDKEKKERYNEFLTNGILFAFDDIRDVKSKKKYHVTLSNQSGQMYIISLCTHRIFIRYFDVLGWLIFYLCINRD